MGEMDLSGILESGEIKEFTIKHEGAEYNFKIRSLPWAKINEILSKSVIYGKNSAIIDKSKFNLLVLSEALVDAPWPVKDTFMYVPRLTNEFGAKLEEHLPKPGKIADDDELKKE